MKKKMRLKIVIVLLILLAGFFYLKINFEKDFAKFSEEIYPTVEEGTYSIYNVNRNVSLAMEDENDSVIALAPGDSYNGRLAVKNHNKVFDFIFKAVAFQGAEDGEAVPLLKFSEEPFRLEQGEFQFFDYQVTVPEGVKPGTYHTILEVYPPEMFDKQDTAVVYIVTAGIDVSVVVDDLPPVYEYQNLLSDPRELAMQHFWYSLRIMLAFLFGFLCLSFIYKAYKK